MKTIDILHINGYIHGDCCRENFVVDQINKRVLMIDIDDSFHVDEFDDLKYDLYECNIIDQIIEIEKKCEYYF